MQNARSSRDASAPRSSVVRIPLSFRAWLGDDEIPSGGGGIPTAAILGSLLKMAAQKPIVSFSFPLTTSAGDILKSVTPNCTAASITRAARPSKETSEATAPTSSAVRPPGGATAASKAASVDESLRPTEKSATCPCLGGATRGEGLVLPARGGGLTWKLIQRSRSFSGGSGRSSATLSASPTNAAREGEAARVSRLISHALTTCHSKPSTKCGDPAITSPGPMLATRHPMATAALIARLRFSVTWYTESCWQNPRCTQRMSTVSSATKLIILQRSTPSFAASKTSIEPERRGRRWTNSGSPPSTSFMCNDNASVSASAKLCPPALVAEAPRGRLC
mmetsp:Transcript_37075/g.83931  ORF Transcript_37075/g.83931 Transcript_37075/m.83931 type:complete len:336 (+) Transcript_37075:2310-3317(+)